MRLRIHHPLFAGFLGVTGLLVLLIVTLVSRGVRRELVATYQQELGRELALGAWILERSDAEDADSVARTITELVGFRVTLIDLSGRVVGESFVGPRSVIEVENHLDRPEVVSALAGELAFAERQSATVGVRLLYGARLARFRDGPIVLRIAAPLERVEGSVDRVQRTIALTGVFATALALLVAYGLSVALARPLVVLAERARQLSEGDFSARVPRGGVAELVDLASGFNRLADELQSRLTELRRDRDEMEALIDTMAEGVVALTEDARILRANRAAHVLLGLPKEIQSLAPVGTLVRHPELRELLEDSVVHPAQVREIQLGERVLLAASRRLDLGGAVTTFLDITEIRRLEKVRRDFVANASHELKTPLTSIRGFAETLLEEDPPEGLRREFLASIRKNTLRLQHLVDDLLDLSRLESGGWTAGRDEVAIGAVAQEAWAELRERASEKGIEFRVEGDAVVLADRQGLIQVFHNLIENAIRHVDDRGHITVRVATPMPGRTEIAVADDGEGIPSRALPRIFERFYRADSSRARDFGGTGLGLAIVRHLVGAMGGEVWADSELGKGTTIRFTLPTG